MAQHQDLVDRITRRKDRGESIDPLVDEIVAALTTPIPSPVYYFQVWVKWLGNDPRIAETELKYLDLTAEQFEVMAEAARKLGKTKSK